MRTIKNHILTAKQAEKVTTIERFQGAFEAIKFQRPGLLESLKEAAIITSSGASTRIEGAMLIDEQVKEFIETDCAINAISSRSEREVAGYVKTLNYIYDHHAQLNISEKTVRELHQLLTEDLTEEQFPSSQKGAYKNVINNVVEQNIITGEIIRVCLKTAAPGLETESAMANLIFDYNDIKAKKECHPLILIAGFVVDFLAIHPFRDGNGRLARLLTTLLLLENGYKWAQYISHEKEIEDSKEAYYTALNSTQLSFQEEVKTYDSWVNYLLTVIAMQTDVLNDSLINKAPIPAMNDNEKRVYNILEAERECMISFILDNVDMSRGGLKVLLKRLVDKGLIKRKGQGRGTTYLVG